MRQYLGDFGFGGVPVQIQFKERQIYTSACSKLLSVFMIFAVVAFTVFEFYSWHKAEERAFETERKFMTSDHDFQKEAESLFKAIDYTYSSWSGVWAVNYVAVVCNVSENADVHHNTGRQFRKIYSPSAVLPLKVSDCQANCTYSSQVRVDPEFIQSRSPAFPNYILRDTWSCDKDFEELSFQNKVHLGTFQIYVKTNNWQNLWEQGSRFVNQDTEFSGSIKMQTVALDSSLDGYKYVEENIRIFAVFESIATSSFGHALLWEKVEIIEHDKFFGMEKPKRVVYRLISSNQQSQEHIMQPEFHSIGVSTHLQTSYIAFHIHPATLFTAIGRIGGVASVILAFAVVLRLYNQQKLDVKLKSKMKLTVENLQDLFERQTLLEERVIKFEEGKGETIAGKRFPMGGKRFPMGGKRFPMGGTDIPEN